MKYYLCLDVGGTEIKYNVLDEHGEIQYETKSVRTPMPKIRDQFGWVPVEEFPEARKEFIQTIEILLNSVKEKISGIAISQPGEIQSETGKIFVGGALNFMGETNLYELLSHIEIPICVENDARCVAIAEHVSGAAKGINNFACITIGTGLGAGFFVDGKVLTGANYRGGEYGASLISQDSDGRYLTFHETSSMSALLMKYGELKHIDFSKNEITGKDVYDHKDDPQVAKIIEDWYISIAICIQNIARTFDSEKILIGGGISARKEVIDGINDALRHISEHTRNGAPWRDTPVLACKYRNSAGLIGAFYKFKELHNSES